VLEHCPCKCAPSHLGGERLFLPRMRYASNVLVFLAVSACT
jgi:hypothetical protein